MSLEKNKMQALNSSGNDVKEVLKVFVENEESKFPRRRLNRKLVYEDEEGNLDDFGEPRANTNDKVGKKRQRKEKDESGLEKETKKKKQDSVRGDVEKFRELKEMWDSITNNENSMDDVVNRPKKDDDDDDDELIIRLFRSRSKKSKFEKKAVDIAMLVEQVMANLEIAVEDDLELNKEGKPAINKLMKLPLLNGALSKKKLQSEFLDHGLLNLLKNWLEPLPDGSLPSINIRTAILKILNDLCIVIEQQEFREQLVKSGLGKVIMFLSKSDEETTLNKRLANDLVNRWGHIIYNKSTRYEKMFTQEEREEQHQMLLARQNKTALKALSETKARDFDVDVDFSEKTKSKLAASSRRVERAKVPTTISMDFVIRPESKVDRELEARVKMQIAKGSHENIIDKLKKRKALMKRSSMRAIKVSVDGRNMIKYM